MATQAAVAPLLAALMAALLHLPVLGHGFVWDDHSLIVHGLPAVPFSGLGRLLTSDFWMITGGETGYWRPLVTASYWLDGRISGFHPGWFHGVNLLAHAITAALVVALLQTLAIPLAAALVAGCVWATMPVHVEAVAWISGRTDLLSALFVVLGLVLDRRDRARGRAAPGVVAIAAFGLALLAKESAVLFLPLVTAFDWVGDGTRRPDARGVARWVAPYLVLVVVYLAVHAWRVPGPVPAGGIDARTLDEVRRAAFGAFPRSLAFLWPGHRFGPEQVLVPERGTGTAASILAIAFHLAFAAAATWLLVRRSRWAPVPLLLWLPALPPLAGMLASGVPLHAERLLYLPSLGVALAIGLALAANSGRRVARAATVAALALATTGAWTTWRLLPVWASDATLYEDITRRSPRSAMGHLGRAETLIDRGQDREAMAELDQAERLQPWMPAIPDRRALLAFRRGQWEEMLAHSRRALALDSLDLLGRQLEAAALLRLGRPDEALGTLHPMIARRPGYPMLAGLEGQALLALGRDAEALPRLEHAMRWIPDDADLAMALATAHARARRWPAARAAYQRVLAIDPGFYEAWLRLATACELVGDPRARDAALTRAAALPQAADGRVETLRRELTGARPR